MPFYFSMENLPEPDYRALLALCTRAGLSTKPVSQRLVLLAALRRLVVQAEKWDGDALRELFIPKTK